MVAASSGAAFKTVPKRVAAVMEEKEELVVVAVVVRCLWLLAVAVLTASSALAARLVCRV
jgi:hypothetical protein